MRHRRYRGKARQEISNDTTEARNIRARQGRGLESSTKVDSIALDTRFDHDEPPNGEQIPLRPIPDGDFELVPLGADPSKGVKIGIDLPDLARKQIKACLRENADLFA